MSAQAIAALRRGDEVRSYRADLKRQLSEGRLRFIDVDLDDKRLQTMRVEALLRALPWKAKPRKAHRYAPSCAHTRYREVFYEMRLFSASRIGSLSAARKNELKAMVLELCPSQRRTEHQTGLRSSISAGTRTGME